MLPSIPALDHVQVSFPRQTAASKMSSFAGPLCPEAHARRFIESRRKRIYTG